MISHEHNCIFIHQRKCAGISIMRAFGLTHPDQDPYAWHFMNDGVLCREYHTRPEDYLRFSVVRNPWDRFVSGWHYCDDTRNVPLRDLLRNLPRLDHDYVHLTRLQRDILFDQCGYLIVEHLMRFENLQRDFDTVCDRIGKQRMVLEHLNRRDDRLPYQEYFRDPVDRDLFMRHFGRDADAFEYEF